MSTYWNNRHKQWLGNQAKMDEAVAKRLQKDYLRMAKELEKEIASYFQRYGQDNVIEFRTMMQDLDKQDRDMLFKDMEAFAEKYPEYAHLMPVRESVYKLNRLQGLHYSTQMKLLELGAIEQKELEKHLEKTYGKRYEQVMKELGLGGQFLSIDRQLMQDTIYAKWVNNENFSQRIWKNKDKLLNHLTTRYRDGLARGDNYAQLTKEIMERFNVGLNDAKRLVWTEASFVYNQSHTHAYQQAGVEEYELTAIMDSKTSRICRAMDGKRFRFDEMEVGVNFPPFHSWCRTTFIGVLEKLDNNDIIKENWDGVVGKFKNTYDQWDGNSVKSLATKIVESENLPLKVQRHKINAYGQCKLTYNNPDIEILTFELNSQDKRSVEYQVKTAFHELFHAKSHGLKHDIGDISFREWAYMDDVFAESTAHHILKSIGINKEIAPSYASHLIETLPKLKKLPEFKECNTIADFGNAAMKYRYSDNPSAEWGTLLNSMKNIDHNVVEYSKGYLEYIGDNKGNLVDKLLENMPQYSMYKDNMINEIDMAVKSINLGVPLSGNEEIIFQNALIITMNRLGVK